MITYYKDDDATYRLQFKRPITVADAEEELRLIKTVPELPYKALEDDLMKLKNEDIMAVLVNQINKYVELLNCSKTGGSNE